MSNAANRELRDVEGLEGCPSPVCQHPKPHVRLIGTAPVYQVRCAHCSAMGPSSVDLERAKGHWNRLPRLPELQVLDPFRAFDLCQKVISGRADEAEVVTLQGWLERYRLRLEANEQGGA